MLSFSLVFGLSSNFRECALVSQLERLKRPGLWRAVAFPDEVEFLSLRRQLSGLLGRVQEHKRLRIGRSPVGRTLAIGVQFPILAVPFLFLLAFLPRQKIFPLLQSEVPYEPAHSGRL